MEKKNFEGQQGSRNSYDKETILNMAKNFGKGYFETYCEAYWECGEDAELQSIYSTMDTDTDYQIVWRFIEDDLECEGEDLDAIFGDSGLKFTYQYEIDIHDSIMEGAREAFNEISSDVMRDIVGEYQSEVDERLEDLVKRFPQIDYIKSVSDVEEAQDIVWEVRDLLEECLTECGKVCGCSMCPGDGYYPSLDALGSWYSTDIDEVSDRLGEMLYDFAAEESEPYTMESR